MKLKIVLYFVIVESIFFVSTKIMAKKGTKSKKVNPKTKNHSNRSKNSKNSVCIGKCVNKKIYFKLKHVQTERYKN